MTAARRPTGTGRRRSGPVLVAGLAAVLVGLPDLVATGASPGPPVATGATGGTLSTTTLLVRLLAGEDQQSGGSGSGGSAPGGSAAGGSASGGSGGSGSGGSGSSGSGSASGDGVPTPAAEQDGYQITVRCDDGSVFTPFVPVGGEATITDAPPGAVCTAEGPTGTATFAPVGSGTGDEVTFTLPAIQPAFSSGPPGYAIRVAGAGWPAGAEVTLQWSRGLRQTTRTTAAEDGTFLVAMLVASGDITGPRLLVASAPTLPAVGARFLVVTPSSSQRDPANPGAFQR